MVGAGRVRKGPSGRCRPHGLGRGLRPLAVNPVEAFRVRTGPPLRKRTPRERKRSSGDRESHRKLPKPDVWPTGGHEISSHFPIIETSEHLRERYPQLQPSQVLAQAAMHTDPKSYVHVLRVVALEVARIGLGIDLAVMAPRRPHKTNLGSGFHGPAANLDRFRGCATKHPNGSTPAEELLYCRGEQLRVASEALALVRPSRQVMQR